MIQIQKKALSDLQKKKLESFQRHVAEQQSLRDQQKNFKAKSAMQNLLQSQSQVFIYNQFKKEFEYIQSALVSKGQIDFSDLLKKLQSIKDYYSSLLYVLKGYDKQSYKDQIQKIQMQIYEVKTRKQPRQKFKFTMRNSDFSKKGLQVQKKHELKKQSKLIHNLVIPGLKQIKQQIIQVPRSQLNQAYQIIDCEDSTFKLKGTVHALHIKRIKNCKIISGPSKSAVHLDSIIDSQLWISGHQIRIHKCVNVIFNLFVGSKAIIQDCSGLIFRQLLDKQTLYDGADRDWLEAGLGDRNQWRQVQDFNWLKNQPSPNFRYE